MSSKECKFSLRAPLVVVGILPLKQTCRKQTKKFRKRNVVPNTGVDRLFGEGDVDPMKKNKNIYIFVKDLDLDRETFLSRIEV